MQSHLRRTFLAGVFAAIPIAVTAAIIWYAESTTRGVVRGVTGWDVPFLGVASAIVLIYLLGAAVSSLIGQWLLRVVDRFLERLPVMRELYRAWKQVSLTPGGSEGIFTRVVLVEDEATRHRTIGFSSGLPLPNDPTTTCVFVPAAPNPTNGRLLFVPIAKCRVLDVSAEEAFKMILSGGNYVPDGIGEATALLESASGRA